MRTCCRWLQSCSAAVSTPLVLPLTARPAILLAWGIRIQALGVNAQLSTRWEGRQPIEMRTRGMP